MNILIGDPNNPQYKDSYYRTDMGPMTILTLDSTNGIQMKQRKQSVYMQYLVKMTLI